MTTKSAQQQAIVRFGALDAPGLSETIEIGTQSWYEWLESNNRFRFEGTNGTFTAYKGDKGFWTAQRKVHQRLRHEHLGRSNALTFEKLDLTARKMAMGDSAYWGEKHSPKRAESPKVTRSHKEKSETNSDVPSQTGEEIAKLKALAVHYSKERDQLANIMADRDAKHTEAMNELLDTIEKLKHKNLQLKNQLAEVEGRTVNTFQIGLALVQKYLSEKAINPIPLEANGKPKARYDQLAKFKDWLLGQSAIGIKD